MDTTGTEVRGREPGTKTSPPQNVTTEVFIIFIFCLDFLKSVIIFEIYLARLKKKRTMIYISQFMPLIWDYQ